MCSAFEEQLHHNFAWHNWIMEPINPYLNLFYKSMNNRIIGQNFNFFTNKVLSQGPQIKAFAVPISLKYSHYCLNNNGKSIHFLVLLQIHWISPQNYVGEICWWLSNFHRFDPIFQLYTPTEKYTKKWWVVSKSSFTIYL